MKIDIVFNHLDFIVVNKPVGISVQNQEEQQGILPVLCTQLNIDKLWLVHRLDKVTSGLLVLAKSSSAASRFGEIFAERNIEKFYLALCDKKPKKKQGLIKGDMKKARDGQWMLLKSQHNPAVTQFFSYGLEAGIRICIIKPTTGKTHQIRVALKSIGSPIIGDTLYKGNTSERVYLHAYALRFTYKNQPFSFLCLPPSGELFSSSFFVNKLDELGQPWDIAWPKLASSKC